MARASHGQIQDFVLLTSSCQVHLHGTPTYPATVVAAVLAPGTYRGRANHR